MMENSLFFVLADGHYNSLGLVRSLGRAGCRIKVFLIGSKDGIVRYSKYAKQITFCATVDRALDTIIRDFADVDGHKFIVTGNDKFVTAIDDRYADIAGRFITYNCGKAGRLRELMSKAAQNELARRAGLNVPDYEVIDLKNPHIPAIPFPVITKATDSLGAHWKDIVYLCHNEQELRDAFSKIECRHVIVQRYIKKQNETGFNGISINGGEQVFLPLQLTYRSTSATSFGNAISLFKPENQDLTDKVKALIKSTGYSGSFSVDLLIGEDSEIYFLEINFRNSGWSYPYTRAGVNLPYTWAKSTIAGHLDTAGMEPKKVPFTAVDEFNYLYEASKRGALAAAATLPLFLKSDSLIFWDMDDMRPFRHLVAATISSHLPRRK